MRTALKTTQVKVATLLVSQLFLGWQNKGGWYKGFLPFCKGERERGKEGGGKEGKRMVWRVRKRRKKRRMVNKKEKPKEGRGVGSKAMMYGC